MVRRGSRVQVSDVAPSEFMNNLESVNRSMSPVLVERHAQRVTRIIASASGALIALAADVNANMLDENSVAKDWLTMPEIVGVAAVALTASREIQDRWRARRGRGKAGVRPFEPLSPIEPKGPGGIVAEVEAYLIEQSTVSV